MGHDLGMKSKVHPTLAQDFALVILKRNKPRR
jgi:hypothetical protein